MVALGALWVACGGARRDDAVGVVRVVDRAPIAAWPRPAALTVLVVYDQFGTWALETHRELLHPDGLLRTTMREGATVWRARYAYAATYTAPGHAAIVSGAPPSHSGVAANKVWSRERSRRISVVDDGAHPVHHTPGAFASPSVLRTVTVGDVLRAATGDRGHVVSLSHKDRGAVLPGGQRPDAALWMTEAAGGFTTSAYYAPAVPDWVRAFENAHPLRLVGMTWEAERAEDYARWLGPDDAAGEGDWAGFGRVFPHRLPAGGEAFEAYLATPMAAERLVDLARAAVVAHELGVDAIPDLLVISVSSTDYAGHTFGGHSWEYADTLRRADHALGRFVAELRRTREVSVLVTSDHGAVPLPERMAPPDRRGHRLLPSHLAASAEAACDATLGAGNWIEAFAQPFLVMSPAARSPERIDDVVACARGALLGIPGVGAVFDVRRAEALRRSADPLERAAGLSLPPDSPGDLLVLPGPGSVIDEEVPRGAGTSHGGPSEEERDVPVIFSGPGIAHGETREVVDQARVASTLAGLLGIAAEWAATLEGARREVMPPLPGAPPLPGLASGHEDRRR
jgi:arylsulfatase A-like enzyme